MSDGQVEQQGLETPSSTALAGVAVSLKAVIGIPIVTSWLDPQTATFGDSTFVCLDGC